MKYRSLTVTTSSGKSNELLSAIALGVGPDIGVRYYAATLKANGQAMRRRILPERLRQQFRMMNLLCYEFENLTPEQEEDLFARVQKGMPLNFAEKFRATRGEWQSLADLFERDFNNVMKRRSIVPCAVRSR